MSQLVGRLVRVAVAGRERQDRLLLAGGEEALGQARARWSPCADGLSHTPWCRWMTSTGGTVPSARREVRADADDPAVVRRACGDLAPLVRDVVLAGLHLDRADLVGLADRRRAAPGRRATGRPRRALGGEGRRVRDVLRLGGGGRLLGRHLLGRTGGRLAVAVARARGDDQDHDADRENGHPLAHGASTYPRADSSLQTPCENRRAEDRDGDQHDRARPTGCPGSRRSRRRRPPPPRRSRRRRRASSGSCGPAPGRWPPARSSAR